jgi:hypothetical protein
LSRRGDHADRGGRAAAAIAKAVCNDLIWSTANFVRLA